MVNLTQKQREDIAAIYFAMGNIDPHGVAAKYLGVDRQEAKQIVYRFFSTQPFWQGVVKHTEHTKHLVAVLKDHLD